MHSTNARTAARTVLGNGGPQDLADPEFIAIINRAEEAGATWVWDPQFTGVVGLMNGQQALVVVYLDDEDFEYDYEATAQLLGK